MHRSSSNGPLSFGASVLYLGKGGKATLGGDPRGDDDERRSPACSAAPDGVGKAQRSRGAEGLHPGVRGTGKDRGQRLSRGGENEGRAGVSALQGPRDVERSRSAQWL